MKGTLTMAYSFLGTTAEVKKFLADLRANGCKVWSDRSVGVAIVTDGDVTVFQAFRYGAGKTTWIMMFSDSDRIKWSPPNGKTST